MFVLSDQIKIDLDCAQLQFFETVSGFNDQLFFNALVPANNIEWVDLNSTVEDFRVYQGSELQHVSKLDLEQAKVLHLSRGTKNRYHWLCGKTHSQVLGECVRSDRFQFVIARMAMLCVFVWVLAWRLN